MAQLSDDCFAFGGRLTPVDEALADLLDRLVVVAAAESVPLAEAAGRFLSEDLVSARSVPPHNNSAVDGYASRPFTVTERIEDGCGWSAGSPPAIR